MPVVRGALGGETGAGREMPAHPTLDSARAMIRQAHQDAAGRLLLTTSGGETSALMPHLVASVIGKDFPLVFVDHGFYCRATYAMVEYFRAQAFDLRIYRSHPAPGDIERHYAGWRDPASPHFSLVVRKIKHEPLNRAFAELKPRMWLRGIMRHETPERQAAAPIQFKNGVYQVHPILDWQKADALDYLELHGLPINADHWDPTKGRDQRGECLIGDYCGVQHSATSTPEPEG
ncbi:phosphoadenosine phosphosulfate reductase [Thiorhodococcus drewsii AZ1]|uniref:Phosphoadenosine phosphosulfate reductase n=1 Tax=Thiorhodococcus drewsii AZ1 TaxID=765913 RepID=G2E5Y2_9GAMM|nr:phosphoadenosine phosphosulfate reductase family protein [Thiorhodococcus drewsii]EGV28545.1 phosphoadenosine phosphosulfate reductase [Thiorhodococcus drewsii AZ1]